VYTFFFSLYPYTHFLFYSFTKRFFVILLLSWAFLLVFFCIQSYFFNSIIGKSNVAFLTTSHFLPYKKLFTSLFIENFLVPSLYKTFNFPFWKNLLISFLIVWVTILILIYLKPHSLPSRFFFWNHTFYSHFLLFSFFLFVCRHVLSS